MLVPGIQWQQNRKSLNSNSHSNIFTNSNSKMNEDSARSWWDGPRTYISQSVSSDCGDPMIYRKCIRARSKGGTVMGSVRGIYAPCDSARQTCAMCWPFYRPFFITWRWKLYMSISLSIFCVCVWNDHHTNCLDGTEPLYRSTCSDPWSTKMPKNRGYWVNSSIGTGYPRVQFLKIGVRPPQLLNAG